MKGFTIRISLISNCGDDCTKPGYPGDRLNICHYFIISSCVMTVLLTIHRMITDLLKNLSRHTVTHIFCTFVSSTLKLLLILCHYTRNEPPCSLDTAGVLSSCPQILYKLEICMVLLFTVNAERGVWCVPLIDLSY